MSSPKVCHFDSTGSPLKRVTFEYSAGNKIMRTATAGSPVVRRLTSRKLVRIPTNKSSDESPCRLVCKEKTTGLMGVARMSSLPEQEPAYDVDLSDSEFLNVVPASLPSIAPIGLELPSPRARLVASQRAPTCFGMLESWSGLFRSNRDLRSAPGAARTAESGTGILVHGCHLLADGWEHIVWGNPPYELGRVPHAVLLAWEEKASVVVFGTGASEIDGKKESEVTVQYMYDHWAELAKFDALKNVPLDEALHMMRRIAVVDTETQNTDQEVRNGLVVMAQKKCTHAVLVSSPTHLPRCLACACKVAGAEPGLFNGPMYASPSDTCYEGASASDVVVVEPPHRGDRDKELDSLQFHELVKRTFRVKPNEKAEFLRELTTLLEKYGV